MYTFLQLYSKQSFIQNDSFLGASNHLYMSVGRQELTVATVLMFIQVKLTE